MGLNHASLRIRHVHSCFFFVPVVHAFLPLVYTFVSVSRYVLVSFARPPRRRAARAMATRWGTSGVRRADVDARRAPRDRSIDFVFSRLGRVHRSKRPRARSSARSARPRARSSPRARARDMTFKIFVGGARVDSNAVLSDAWNSSSVRARRSRAREARGERREARGAPNLGFLSNAHFLGVSLTVRLTDDEYLCARAEWTTERETKPRGGGVRESRGRDGMGRGITPGGCQRGGRRGGAFAGEKTRDAVTRRARGDARVFFNRRSETTEGVTKDER